MCLSDAGLSNRHLKSASQAIRVARHPKGRIHAIQQHLLPPLDCSVRGLQRVACSIFLIRQKARVTGARGLTIHLHKPTNGPSRARDGYARPCVLWCEQEKA
jgi:hypothetical protein